MPARPKKPAVTASVTASFGPVASALSRTRDVTLGPGWGAGNLVLKVKGKIFAMTIQGDLVVKLPRARAAALVDEGCGRPFDPRKNGRLMKEWVVVAPGAADWVALAREAFAFVKAKAA